MSVLFTATPEPRQLVPWPEALLSSCWAQHSPAAVVFLPTLAACTNTAKQRGNLCKGLLLHSPSPPRQFLPWGLFHTLAELGGTSGIPLLQPHCSSRANCSRLPRLRNIQCSCLPQQSSFGGASEMSIRDAGSHQQMPLTPGSWVCSPPRKRRLGGSSQLHMALFGLSSFGSHIQQSHQSKKFL